MRSAASRTVSPASRIASRALSATLLIPTPLSCVSWCHVSDSATSLAARGPSTMETSSGGLAGLAKNLAHGDGTTKLLAECVGYRQGRVYVRPTQIPLQQGQIGVMESNIFGQLPQRKTCFFAEHQQSG